MRYVHSAEEHMTLMARKLGGQVNTLSPVPVGGIGDRKELSV